jgi:hypothetical protein
MGAWDFLANAAGLTATALLVIALRWAAIERAKAHREWARRRREDAAPVINWWVATWAVAGCL